MRLLDGKRALLRALLGVFLCAGVVHTARAQEGLGEIEPEGVAAAQDPVPAELSEGIKTYYNHTVQNRYIFVIQSTCVPF